MSEAILLGLIQGFTEWLPVSSEGMLVLAKANLFGQEELISLVEWALFLHLGTFLAAFIYLRKEVGLLFQGVLHYRQADPATQQVLRFLLLATAVSGLLGAVLLQAISGIEAQWIQTGKGITLFIGVLLLVTGGLQLSVSRRGTRGAVDLGWPDALLLGFVQGLAVLPGLSRSGLTVSALLLRGVDKTEALRLSFLMSMPVVLAGNIVLHFHSPQLSGSSLLAVAVACLAGLLTIHLLFRIAKGVNFGYFVLGFGILTIAAAWI